LEDAHLRIFFFDIAAQVETEQFTGFTIAGAGVDEGGTVSFTVAPPTGTRITIYREVPLTQETDYVENTKFPADAHERALDLLTMQNQQQREALGRAVKLPISAIVSDISLPDPIVGRALKWNADGTDLENSTYDFDTAVTLSQAARDAAQTAQGLAEDAQAAAEAAAANTAANTAMLLAGYVAAGEAARDVSVTAKGQSETARDASIAAKTQAETARDAAAASAAAVNLPSATGHGTHFIRQKATEDGFEYRTPSQVLSDIGAPTATDLSAVSTKAQTGIDIGVSAYIKADVAGNDAAGVYGRVFSDDFETDTIGAGRTGGCYDSTNKRYGTLVVGAESKYAVTSGMLSINNGAQWPSWRASLAVDGNTGGTYAFYDNNFVGGQSRLTLDIGAGNTAYMTKFRVYKATGGVGVNWAFNIYWSDDGVTWSLVDDINRTTLDSGSGWFDITWTRTTSPHRYWSWFITGGTGGPGSNYHEIEWHSTAVSQGNMTLISGATALAAEPNDVSIYALVTDTDAVTNGVDRKLYASIDGGTTYTAAVSYTVVGNFGSSKKIVRADVNVAAQTGTSLKWKAEALNGKVTYFEQITGYAA